MALFLPSTSQGLSITVQFCVEFSTSWSSKTKPAWAGCVHEFNRKLDALLQRGALPFFVALKFCEPEWPLPSLDNRACEISHGHAAAVQTCHCCSRCKSRSNGPWKKNLLYDKRLAQGARMKPSGYQLRTFSKLNVERIMHLGWNTMNHRPCFWLIFTGIGGRNYFYLGKGEVGESQWISTATELKFSYSHWGCRCLHVSKAIVIEGPFCSLGWRWAFEDSQVAAT